VYEKVVDCSYHQKVRNSFITIEIDDESIEKRKKVQGMEATVLAMADPSSNKADHVTRHKEGPK
jgi:hypothetical protein